MQCNPQQMPSVFLFRRGPREINYCCASCECEDIEFARVADDIFWELGLYSSCIFPIKNQFILLISDMAFSENKDSPIR